MVNRFLLFGLVTSIGLIAFSVYAAPAPKEKTNANEQEEEVEALQTTLDLKKRAIALKSSNNLKRIALGVMNYDLEHGILPQNIVDKDGKPLLSWRVRILPQAEQKELHKKFKLDEPWDSENNLKLLDQMPKFLESPRVKVKKKGFTVYLGFEGNGALFGSNCKLTDIMDGTANTILCVESSVAVPWTKPVDLPFDPKKDVPNFGKAYGDEPLILTVDGATRVLNTKKVSTKTLKAAIGIKDGIPLGNDW